MIMLVPTVLVLYHRDAACDLTCTKKGSGVVAPSNWCYAVTSTWKVHPETGFTHWLRVQGTSVCLGVGQVGEGEFGTVHRAKWYGTVVAVKILRRSDAVAVGDFRWCPPGACSGALVCEPHGHKHWNPLQQCTDERHSDCSAWASLVRLTEEHAHQEQGHAGQTVLSTL